MNKIIIFLLLVIYFSGCNLFYQDRCTATCNEWERCDKESDTCLLDYKRCANDYDCSYNSLCNQYTHQCENPCARIDCGSNGYCGLDENRNVICNCNYGYIADGLDCIEKPCDENDMMMIECGFNNNGQQYLRCINKQWIEEGICIDDDICKNDSNNTLESKKCIHGQWVEYEYPLWLEQVYSQRGIEFSAITKDNNDNIYLLDISYGEIDKSTYEFGLFLSKYDEERNLIWTKYVGKSNRSSKYSIITDENNHIIINGYNEFMALYKFNIFGNKIWSYEWGYKQSDIVNSLFMDENDNIFVTGGFYKSETYSYDAFAGKIDKDGNKIWLKMFMPGMKGMSITGDIYGNIFITGQSNLNNDADYSATSVFLAKFNTDGQKQWLKEMVSTRSYANTVKTDKDGNVYVSGYTEGRVYKGSTVEHNIFLMKFDNDGNNIWKQHIGFEFNEESFDMAFDSLGNIFVLGEMNGTLDELVCIGGTDIILIKFDKDGNKQWIKRWGTSKYDSAKSIYIDKNDNIYIAGHTTGNFKDEESSDDYKGIFFKIRE